MEPAAKKARASSPTSSNGLTKRKVPDEERVHWRGYKLRGGCVPWRFAPGPYNIGSGEPQGIEVMLIEGLNSPGQWSFPGGSLDPGEEVSRCAGRETAEESGVLGVLGCFLGMFAAESKKKKGGSWSYIWTLKVTTVLNEGSLRWKDPDSTWESDGWRNRGWFSPAAARPLLKEAQKEILEAALKVPLERWTDVTWRTDPEAGSARPPAGGPTLSVLLLGKGVDESGIFDRESHALAGWTDEDEPRGLQVDVLKAGAGGDLPRGSAAQEFALAAAALWQADAVIAAGVDGQYMAGLAAAAGKPVLVLVPSAGKSVLVGAGAEEDVSPSALPLLVRHKMTKTFIESFACGCRRTGQPSGEVTRGQESARARSRAVRCGAS